MDAVHFLIEVILISNLQHQKVQNQKIQLFLIFQIVLKWNLWADIITYIKILKYEYYKNLSYFSKNEMHMIHRINEEHHTRYESYNIKIDEIQNKYPHT